LRLCQLSEEVKLLSTGAAKSNSPADYGKKGALTKVLPGSALKIVIDDSTDNAGKGDGFSISTASGYPVLW
jgi:hypothetical protein